MIRVGGKDRGRVAWIRFRDVVFEGREYWVVVVQVLPVDVDCSSFSQKFVNVARVDEQIALLLENDAA